MSQALLFVVIHLIGLVATLPLASRARGLACALAYPVGLVVVVVAALGVLAIGLPYTPAVVGLVAAALVAALLVAGGGRRPGRDAVAFGAAWSIGFALACVALSATNLAILSLDSHRFVMLGRVIAADRGLSPSTFERLDEWGVFQVVVHSMAGWTDVDFLYAAPVVLGGSFVALFAASLWRVFADLGPRRRFATTALVTAAVFGSSMAVYHLFYLHSNLAAACYLFAFVALTWLAEEREARGLLPLAFVALIGFALQRVETALVAIVFLALLGVSTQLDRRALAGWTATFAAVVAGWFVLLAGHLDPAGAFLTPTRCLAVAAAVAASWPLMVLVGRPRFAAVVRKIPILVAVLSALVVGAAFAVAPSAMATSASSWLRNLVTVPHWGHAWPLLAAIALTILAARRRTDRPLPPTLTVGVFAYAAFILLLSFVGRPYRLGIGDSANRMTIHLVPLIVLALARLTFTADRDARGRPRSASGDGVG